MSSSIGICHTNIASLSKHINELKLTLSLLRNEFHIIAITEHKIRRGVDTLVNINIPGYKPFIIDIPGYKPFILISLVINLLYLTLLKQVMVVLDST